tara:strand:+ start:593 stop:778 length:186 start_codon:yes stop_codon:yes gene_type:complete
MKAIIDNIKIIEKPRGTKIFRKGDRVGFAYLSLLGEVDLFDENVTNNSKSSAKYIDIPFEE